MLTSDGAIVESGANSHHRDSRANREKSQIGSAYSAISVVNPAVESAPVLLPSYPEGFMFDFIRRMVVAFLNRHRPFSPPRHRPFRPPDDPYASVREPLRRSPGGRSSAIALAEPEPVGRVRVIGTAETGRRNRDELYED